MRDGDSVGVTYWIKRGVWVTFATRAKVDKPRLEISNSTVHLYADTYLLHII